MDTWVTWVLGVRPHLQLVHMPFLLGLEAAPLRRSRDSEFAPLAFTTLLVSARLDVDHVGLLSQCHESQGSGVHFENGLSKQPAGSL